MEVEQSLWHFFADAGPVVKAVMILLLMASVMSWTLIIQRAFIFRHAKRALIVFEEQFWSINDINRYYQHITKKRKNILEGLDVIFYVGFREFAKLREKSLSTNQLVESVQRVMQVAAARELVKFESNLGVLATIGSTSPYVGLFGTVWGIMTSFRALGSVQQATIAMVAPGISEALIATAVGLFAAIPAVIAYNRYAIAAQQLADEYQIFQDEFISIIVRQFCGRSEVSAEELDGMYASTAA